MIDVETRDPVRTAPPAPLAPSGRTPAPRGRDLQVVAAATGLAAATWLLLTRGLGLELTVPRGGEVREVALGGVVLSAALASVAGAVLLRLLESRLRHGRRTWVVLACLVLVVSFAGPAGATTTGAVAGLWSLHLVVAGVLVGGLRWVRRG